MREKAIRGNGSSSFEELNRSEGQKPVAPKKQPVPSDDSCTVEDTRQGSEMLATRFFDFEPLLYWKRRGRNGVVKPTNIIVQGRPTHKKKQVTK